MGNEYYAISDNTNSVISAYNSCNRRQIKKENTESTLKRCFQ